MQDRSAAFNGQHRECNTRTAPWRDPVAMIDQSRSVSQPPGLSQAGCEPHGMPSTCMTGHEAMQRHVGTVSAGDARHERDHMPLPSAAPSSVSATCRYRVPLFWTPCAAARRRQFAAQAIHS